MRFQGQLLANCRVYVPGKNIETVTDSRGVYELTNVLPFKGSVNIAARKGQTIFKLVKVELSTARNVKLDIVI